MVREDEKAPAQRHRRWISLDRERGVLHAVPIADEWIGKIEDQDEGEECRGQPPAPRLPKRSSDPGQSYTATAFCYCFPVFSVRRVCRQRCLGQRVELQPVLPVA